MPSQRTLDMNAERRAEREKKRLGRFTGDLNEMPSDLRVVGAAATKPTPPPWTRLIQGDSAYRKQFPIGTGVLDYFPDALAEVARISKAGNDKHNPGEPLHWARGKSMDHADCIIRHYEERGGFDSEGQRHSAQLAWRALALLQEELEKAYNLTTPRGATELPLR